LECGGHHGARGNHALTNPDLSLVTADTQGLHCPLVTGSGIDSAFSARLQTILIPFYPLKSPLDPT